MIQLKTIDGAPAPIKRSPPLKMLIADIDIGERHRKEMGDLEGLADSILDQGLLQPIGVTENRELVFGERRLRACRDILGWKDIDCRVVNVSSIVEGERAENEIRKQFSVSERVAIGKAIEDRLAGRQGERIDIRPSDELRENIPEVPLGKRTSEMAADAAGFGNRKTYEQARKVVNEAQPAVVEALDKGEISVSAAAVIATQPPEEQNRVIALPHAEVRARVAAMRKKASDFYDNLTPSQRSFQIFEAFLTIGRMDISAEEFLAHRAKESIGDLKRIVGKLRALVDAIEGAK